MTPIERVIKRAYAEVGYLEKATNSNLDDKTANAGYGNYTKYARDLDAMGVYNGGKNGYSWCDVFYDWLLIQEFGLDTALKMLYQPKGGLGAGCYYSAQYYRNNGSYYNYPQVGDQIFFVDGDNEEYHTGIVTAVDSRNVYTIEGNTSSNDGVVDNGGCVAAKMYPLDYYKIGGYGRPNWKLVEEDFKLDEKTIAEIKKIVREVLDEPKSDVVPKWAVASGEWVTAINMGITDGTRPNDPVTRVEAAAMVVRAKEIADE